MIFFFLNRERERAGNLSSQDRHGRYYSPGCGYGGLHSFFEEICFESLVLVGDDSVNGVQTQERLIPHCF